MTQAALVLAGLGAACGVAATWLARRLSPRLGLIDRPNSIVPQHTQPVARLGGVGVAAGAAAALGLGRWLGLVTDAGPLVRPAFVASLFLLLGLLDDWKRLSPAPKLALQAVAAAAALAAGLAAPITGVPFADATLSLLLLLTVVNAFNLTDVCDGLLAGLAAVSLCAFVVLAPAQTPLILAAAGACMGFLIFNRPPASIFLGDAGSQGLGALAAALALQSIGGRSEPDLWTRLAQVALVLAVPLFELVFLTLVRLRKGLPWWRGSPDHFSLRMQAAGLSRWATDLAAWCAAALLALLALALPSLPRSLQGVSLAATGVAALGCGLWLTRHEVVPRRSP